MRQALIKSWPILALGVALTLVASATVYYGETNAITKRADLRTQQSLQRTTQNIQKLVWHVELVADYMRLSDPQWTSQGLKNFLTKLEPDLQTESGWFVSQVGHSLNQQSVPVEAAPGSAASSSASGNETGVREPVAPVIFVSAQWVPRLEGVNLLSVNGFSGLDNLRSDAAQIDVMPQPLAAGIATSGSIIISHRVLSNSPGGSEFILSRLIAAPEIASLLELEEGRRFAITGRNGQILGDRALLSGSARIFKASVGKTPEFLQLALSQSNMRSPSWWIAVATLGTLLTALAVLWSVSASLGMRSRRDQAELSGAKLTLDRIRHSEEALFEHAGTANCVVDGSTGKFLRVNSRMVDLLGYSKEELLGKTFSDVTHPDDLSNSQAAVKKFAGTDDAYVQFQKRYLHKDGHTIHTLVNSRPIRSIDMTQAFATAIIDISQAKEQERLRDSLVRELAHRVRNTVQLISGLARQTAKSARSVRDFDEKFQERLNALRAAQDALFDTNWKEADLATVVKRSLAPFAGGNPGTPNFTTSVPPLPLPPQHAQTVAIAIHELAANSAVWGALARGGKVEIDGRIEKSDLGEVLVMQWSETTPSVIRPPKKRGFGIRMLESGLPDQFGGSSKLTWRRHGLEYRAVLPIASLQTN